MSAFRLVLALLVSLAGSAFSAVARPAYETESWPSARTLIWAKPGTSGAFAEAANWLEQGQPAATASDRNADVVLPAADQSDSETAPPNAEVLETKHPTVWVDTSKPASAVIVNSGRPSPASVGPGMPAGSGSI